MRQHRIGYHSHQALIRAAIHETVAIAGDPCAQFLDGLPVRRVVALMAPRYTVMFIYRLSNVIALFDPLTVVPTIR